MWPIPGSFIDKVHKKNETINHNNPVLQYEKPNKNEKSILHKAEEYTLYGITLGFGSSVGDKCINYLFPKPYTTPIMEQKPLILFDCEQIRNLKVSPIYTNHHVIIDTLYNECIQKRRFQK